MLTKALEIGDAVYLTNPYRGYRAGLVTAYCGVKIIVTLESGLEIQVYPEELEEIK